VKNEQVQREQPQNQVGHADQQAQSALEAGEFQKAIDIYEEVYKKYPKDATIRSGYIRTLESIRSTGDRNFERNHFELAGDIYGILAKNWLHFSGVSPSLSFSTDFLEKKIKTSRILLGEKQTLSYLATGEFQKAIDIYEEVYKKYPEDATVRSGYIRTLESIRSTGDRNFERNHFELAGNIYGILARNWLHFSGVSPSLSFSTDFLEKKIKTSRILLGEKQALSYLAAGEFQKAIDIHIEVYKKYPEDAAVRSSYIRTLELIRSTADQAFERSNFELAGGIYGLLLKHFSSITYFNGSYRSDRRVLAEKMKTCKKILFENGLEKYRSGTLDQAISIWKGILAFDPEDQEIKKTLDIAILQSHNLEKTK
jgi:tetratricopeptide (TPR) repeat protein